MGSGYKGGKEANGEKKLHARTPAMWIRQKWKGVWGVYVCRTSAQPGRGRIWLEKLGGQCLFELDTLPAPVFKTLKITRTASPKEIKKKSGKAKPADNSRMICLSALAGDRFWIHRTHPAVIQIGYYDIGGRCELTGGTWTPARGLILKFS